MKINTQILLAFLIIALIPLSTIGFLSYFDAKSALTNEVLSRLESVADIQESRVESIVEQNLERLSLVSSRTQLRLSLDSYIAAPNTADQDMMVGILMDARASVDSFEDICIITLEGDIIASTDESEIGDDYPHEAMFVRGQSQNSADTFFLNDDGGLSVYLSGPLYLEDSLLGVVVIESSADTIIAAITDYTGLGNTGETVLATRNEDGDALFLMPTRFEEGAALSLTVAEEEGIPIIQALSGEETLFTDAADYRGQSVMAATRYLEEVGWGLVTKIDRAEALAPVADLRSFLFAVIFITLALVMGVALYLARVITRPIKELTRATARISQGDLSQPVDFRSTNEVGMLAHSFNEMMGSLRKSEQRYRDTLDNMLEGCQIIDSDWRYLYVNDAVARHGRQTKEGLLGHTMMEVYPGIEDTEMFKHLKRCMKERSSYRMENEFSYPDGTKGWFELSFEPVPEGIFILSIDITERKRMEEALLESEEKYRNLVERANDGVCILQENSVKYCNQRLAELWGGEVAEIIGRPFLDFVHPDSLEEVGLRYKRRMVGEDVPAIYEAVLKRRDGSRVFVEMNAGIIDYEGKPADMAIIRDITERKMMEQALQGYNRALRVLSLGNQAVVHSTSESKLLNEVCRILTEEGGYVMSWAGFAEHDRAKTVRPVACCGCDEDFLKTVRITWSDTKRGRGPTGTAIRTGQPSVIKDVVNDSSYTPWRKQALERGFASSIALPLIAEDQTLGALNIYAVQPDAFDQAEIGLLAELASDLAYGVTALRARQERDQAEEKLETYLENAPDGVYIISARDGTIIYGNQRAGEISGYRKEELIGHSFLDLHLVAPEYVARAKKMLERNAQGETTGPNEYEIVKKDGQRVQVEISATPVKQDGGYAVIGIIRDVTERHRAGEALRESEKFLDSVIENTPNPIWVSDEKGTVIRMNRALRNLLKIEDEEIIGKYNVLNDAQVIEQGYLPLVKRVFEKGETVSFTLNYDTAEEKQVKLAETTRRVLEIVISAVKNVDGKVINAICQQKDITEQERARGALRESEERLSLAVEGTNLGLWDWKVQTGEVVFNERWAEIVGYTLEELAPVDINTWTKLVHPDDLKKSNELLERHFAGESDYYECEARMKHKNGEWIWVLDKGKVVERDKGGKPVRMAGTHLDINEPKRAREAQLQSEANMAEAQRVAKIGSWRQDIATGDSTWSAELYNMNRCDPALPPPPFKDFLEMLHPEDHHLLVEVNARVEKTGQPTTVEFRSNPALGPVHYFLGNVELIRDAEGRPIALSGTQQDVTEMKMAEEALRQSEEKLRTTLESIPEGVTVTALDGIILQVNDAVLRMHGFDSPQEMVGKRAGQFVAEEDRTKAEDTKNKVLETGLSDTLECTLLRRDGSRFPVELSLAVIKDDLGKSRGLVSVTEDITERKQMEEKLMMTDRLASVGELASGIAHELNNPLTGVIGLSEMLLEEDLPGGVKEDLTLVYSEAQRAAQVVKNLLTFARKHPTQKQVVNVNEIIEKVLELRAYEQRVHNIEVVRKLATDLPEVTADYFQLQQVFLNIIINAEYFMIKEHGKGTLTITTERVDEKVRVSFADDGPGIARESIGHLFDPFFTTKEVGKGTGLGLSICHGIVTEHGGTIYAESELGEGATFVVELPAG